MTCARFLSFFDMKKYLFLIFVLLFAFVLVSCDTGYTHCEMTLPLDKSYDRIHYDGFDASFSDGAAIVGMLRISFSAGFNQGIPETMNPREFANFWKNRVGRDEAIKLDRVTPYYTYNEEGYFYVNGFYRSQNAYFVVLLACPEESYNEYYEKFLDILDGATLEK